MGNRAPAEILQVIFAHIVEPEGCPLVPSGRFVSTELQARRTLVACTTVCRAWREPAQAALYRRLYLGKLSDRDVRHLIETLNAREDLGNQVLSLVIRATGPGQPTTNTVGELFSLLPMIRYITLDTSLALMGQFDKNCMPTETNSHLTHLSVRSTGGIFHGGMGPVKLPRSITHLAFQGVAISDCHRPRLPYLKQLHLDDISAPWTEHMLEDCKALEEVYFNEIGQATLANALAKIGSLAKYLQIKPARNTTGHLEALRNTVPNLEKLDYYGRIEENELSSVPDMPHFNWIAVPNMAAILPFLLELSSNPNFLSRLESFPWISTTDYRIFDASKPYMEAAEAAEKVLKARGLKAVRHSSRFTVDGAIPVFQAHRLL